MSQDEQFEGKDDPGSRSGFPKTRWSVVLDAQGDDPEALATFCRAYWFPLYSFARRLHPGPTDAEDLTQAFFERLLSRDLLLHARSERGRLRTFLLHAFKNFAAEEWRKQQAQKRGGEHSFLSLDALSAEDRLALEPHHRLTPEVEYERAWARALLRQALAKLEADYVASGNQTVFQALRDQLAEGASERSYKEISEALGVSEGAARFAAFKMRQRYRAAVRDSVAETVTRETEIEEELNHLQLLFDDRSKSA